MFLSYDGANYHGWQRQPNGASVEEAVERALSLLIGRKTDVTGAGRTDAGVNALYMPAHFDIAGDTAALLPMKGGGAFEQRLHYKLNRILPPDIAVRGILKVRPDAHARFDAVERTYHYYVTAVKDPFRASHCLRIPPGLDFDRMNEAAAFLVGKLDAASFAKAGSDVKTTVCDVRRARWEAAGQGLWRFEMTADRFLRNMVRAVVGTLLDVGRGRIQPGEMEAVIRGRNRCAAGESVSGGALFLHKVRYPESVFMP